MGPMEMGKEEMLERPKKESKKKRDEDEDEEEEGSQL